MANAISNGVTQKLADFSLGLKYEDLPPDVINESKHGFLDTLGVALVGANEEATRMILKITVGANNSGTSTVLGSSTLATPTVAALVNGYAAHALDYDDTQHKVGTHMSAPVLPAALVAAEMAHRSGKELLTAYTAGFDVGCRLARVAGFASHLSKRGIHSTGYLGHFGAVAAAGKMLGLDSMQLRRAFGIAAGHASGIMISFGTMAKAQNAANAAQNAVLAVLLAQAGFTAPEQMFDGEKNIFSICGATTDPEGLVQNLGKDFDITSNTLKVYACAGWRNPIIDASTLLATTHGLKPADIAKVNVWACKDVMHLPNYPEPKTGLEAKFSAQYASAVAITDHLGGVKQFSDARVADPALAALTRRVSLASDEKLGPFQIRVDIRTTDGRDLSHFIPSQKGDHLNPLSWDELVVKFSANALAVLPKANVDKLVPMLHKIEDVKDVAELTRLCRP